MLISLLIILFVSISFVSAQEDNSTDVCLNKTVDEPQILEDSDIDDLVYNLTSANIKKTYFKSGTLRETYDYATFSITEDMSNFGILNIKAKNVTINGNNHTLTNTVFCIQAGGVTLNNFTLDVTNSYENNEYAALEVWKSDNARIYNVNINYNPARDMEAYCVYSYLSNNLQIINCTFNLNGDNRALGRDYAVKIENSQNAIIRNNKINAQLPLRTVAFLDTTAILDSEFSLAVGITGSDNLVFDSNTVNCSVNVRPECQYPTLDAIFIGDSANCNFTNNNIYLSDFISYPDMPNYLYGVDVYRADNLLIQANNIRVETTGGSYAAGTAYPIQLTGPAEGIIIQYNNIYSKSNGPNIGIYSQNFNGENYITILNNYINVTGLAGNHSWALVAGIEAQDDNDIIMNNIIEIHNIQKVAWSDNIYGISYSQKTEGTHTYRVVNNTVISDGYYLSHMLDADNTTVTNNTLVRTDKYAKTDYDPFKRGDSIGKETDAIKNNDFSGNRVITIFEYDLEHQSNEISGGEEFQYTPPENVNNISNVINGSGISPLKPGFPGGNPLIPGSNGGGAINTGGSNAGGFSNPDSADGSNGNNGLPDLSGDDGKSLSKKQGGVNANTVNSFNNQGTSSNSYNNQVASQNSSSSKTPSVSGVATSGASSKSASSSSAGVAGSSGVSKDTSKAYEITKNIVENGPDDMIMFIGFAVLCEILLFVGYRRNEVDDY